MIGRGFCLALLVASFLVSSCSEREDTGRGKTKGILVAGADTIGLPSPQEAEILGAEAWVNERDKSGLGWKFDGDVLEIVPGTGNLRTRKEFGDCRIHVEFLVEGRTGVEWKNDGNSGIYIQRRYEVQILNLSLIHI